MEKAELEQLLAMTQAREKVFANASSDDYLINMNDREPYQGLETIQADRLQIQASTLASDQRGYSQITHVASEDTRFYNESSRRIPSSPSQNLGMFEIRNRDLLVRQNNLMEVLAKLFQHIISMVGTSFM